MGWRVYLRVVMSIWKLRVGSEAYYLAQVANGLEDYYTGRGEDTGRWLGAASTGLGLELDGPVDGGELRAVLAGLQPGTGRSPNGGPPLVHRRRIPGFDLTFAAPKSVSVLYGLGDPLVQSVVVEAHDRAVAEAVAWLEREACHVRRGSNNRATATGASAEFGTRRLPGAGFVAAGFRHRSSRAGDPHLHTHVLVANTSRGPDGRWSALDATGLYRSKHAAGAVFRTALARELTERLGVSWRPAGKGLIEIAGMPREVLAVFSKRREEIEAHMAAHGTEGAEAAAEAMLETRRVKADVDPARMRDAWRAEAADTGFDTDALDELLARKTVMPDDHTLLVPVPDPTTGELVEQPVRSGQFAGLVGARMADVDAVCTRLQITEIVADLLPGIGTRSLEQVTAWVLAQPELIPIDADAPPAGHATGWEQRWTSRWLLGIEADLIAAIADTSAVQPPVPDGLIDTVIAATSLGPDQGRAVQQLCGSQRPVGVLVGRAGTGKTYTLNTVRQVLGDRCGRRVIGVAPSARAARELADGAGIDAYTFPRFQLHAAADLDANTVVIVDEAGMAGTVDLHRVITHARSVGARVILVGDHHQLPEIGAGGTFRAAVDVLGDDVAELTVNRRQHAAWEHDALDQLRHGNPLAGFRAYLDHGCVTIADTNQHVHDEAVEAWVTAHQTGVDGILLAGTRAEATALNRLARSLVINELSGRVLEVRGRQFQRGDRIVMLRNAGWRDGHLDRATRRLTRLDNGMVGTIHRIRRDGRVDVTLTNGRRVRIAADYIRAGHIDHGYATTIHKAQGLTCDRMFLVGPAGLYREAVYVAMSRARHGSHLFATAAQVAELVERPHTHGVPLPDEHPDELDHDIRRAVNESRAKRLAITHNRLLPVIDQVAAGTPLDMLWERHVHIRHVTAKVTAAGVADPDIAAGRLAAAREHRRYLAPGVRVNAADWDNVGVVIAVIDNSGLAYIEFTSSDGRRRTRRLLEWADTRPVDHPEPVDIPTDADTYFTLAQEIVDQTATEWAAALARHGVAVDEIHVVPAAIAMRRQRLAHQLAGDPPTWLATWLGQRPDDPVGAQVWDDELTQLAAWRDARHLPAAIPGYGPRADDPYLLARWNTHLDRSLDTRCWLQHHHPNLPPPTPVEIDIVAVRERLAELDTILATAPPDQRLIIDALHAGQLFPADVHTALHDAARGQDARRQWILEHWPHVVEHAELTTISDHHDALAHWPAPMAPAVDDLWQQLLAHSVDTPEPASIGELDAQAAEQHPMAILQRLKAERDQLAEQRRQLRVAASVERAGGDLHRPHIERLNERISHLDRDINGHGARVALWEWDQHSGDLDDRLQRRANHLAHTALTHRATWAVIAVSQWSDHHSQEPADTLRGLLLDIATYRERHSVASAEPLGPAIQHPDGEQLAQRLTRCNATTISDLLSR